MANPLFSILGGMGGGMSMPGNISGLIQQFQQFKRSFVGDPRQQVQELLNSGRMTQQQFNQLQAVAKQFQALI